MLETEYIYWGQSYNMVLCKYIFRNLNWPFISGGCNVQRNVKILMYPFVKLSSILKCVQINKLHQNAKFLWGFLFNLNVFFCKTVIGIEMYPNKQIVSKYKIFAGISLQLEKVNAIYFNIVLVLQDWLNPYCTDKNSNVFAWMARTIHSRCPVDGATLVVMAKLLDTWSQIFNCEGLWDTDTQGPHSAMMFLVYLGGGKFVKPHVGKFLNHLVNFVLNANIL